MIDSILSPLDGSQVSEAGLAWAHHAAQRSGARLDLLRVIDPEKAATNGHAEEAGAYLRTLKDRCLESGVVANTEVAIGETSAEILARAASASLTVMTYSSGRWSFGSDLDVLMREMVKPVVVVRANPGQPIPNFDTEKIIVPVTQSATSRAVLPAAMELCRDMRASLILMNVVPPIAGITNMRRASAEMAAAVDQQIAEARAFLEAVAGPLSNQGVHLEACVAVGDAAREIIQAARQLGAGLIAMATRGNSSLSAMMGSVAMGVVQASPVPCLVMRAGTASPR
jgi:nucleotide-binding universal stress UspA family protein